MKIKFEPADFQGSGQLIIRESFERGCKDYEFGVTVAFKIGFQPAGNGVLLIALSDGMASVFKTKEALCASLNADAYGYRPMSADEIKNIVVGQGNRFSGPFDSRKKKSLAALTAVMALLNFWNVSPSLASEVSLKWDPSPTTNVAEYVLYASTNALGVTNLETATVRLNVGTNLTASLEGIQPGQWSFAATAIKDGVESDTSNILIVDVPEPPARMRVVAVQYGGTLTNFYDVGFFRLRLP